AFYVSLQIIFSSKNREFYIDDVCVIISNIYHEIDILSKVEEKIELLSKTSNILIKMYMWKNPKVRILNITGMINTNIFVKILLAIINCFSSENSCNLRLNSVTLISDLFDFCNASNSNHSVIECKDLILHSLIVVFKNSLSSFFLHILSQKNIRLMVDDPVDILASYFSLIDTKIDMVKETTSSTFFPAFNEILFTKSESFNNYFNPTSFLDILSSCCVFEDSQIYPIDFKSKIVDKTTPIPLIYRKINTYCFFTCLENFIDVAYEYKEKTLYYKLISLNSL
ncbi:hypothetical protein MXB_3201, partial [Myxobolus squamalis]